MNIKIWHKLAILLLATTSLTIVIGIGLSQQSFKRGFQDYLQHQEQRRLEVLAQNLISAYEEKGNWNFLRNNNRLWLSFLRSSGEHFSPGRGRRRTRPFSGTLSEPLSEAIPPPHDRDKRRPFRPMGPRSGPPKMSLLDTDKQMIVGIPAITDATYLQPLKNNGRVIAYIAIKKKGRIVDRLDKIFAAQQNQAFIVNTLVSLVVSLIVALLASVYFRKRMSPLTHIAQHLTSGQYEQRVHITHKDELGQLGNNFNILAQTLQKNQQSQQHWIADISHELRTPVAILKGELEALEDGIRPLDKNSIHSLRQETERLNSLINDLYQLSIADMGALKYEKTDFDINKLLQEVYERFKLRFQQQNLTLHYSDAGTGDSVQAIQYHGDRQRLYQLLSILLENSLRYTDTGGEIRIKLTNNERDIRLIVEDSAPGIEEDKQPFIFDRLFRLESSRNRSKGGAGLGLAIAKQIVMAHEGDISAHTSELGGVQISCRLAK